MKFWDKYTERIEIPESDLNELSQIAMNACMKEGELRYREYLLEVLGRIKELLEEDGGKSKISIDALISIVEQEPGEYDD